MFRIVRNIHPLKKKQPKLIAYLEPHLHPSIENTRSGFTDALTSVRSLDCSFMLFNTQGNQEQKMNTALYHLYDSKPDLVFSIGMRCTRKAVEYMNHNKKKTPLVFAGVHQPLISEITGHGEMSDAWVTGLAGEVSNYRMIMSRLKAITAGVQRIGLLFSPSSPIVANPDERCAQIIREIEECDMVVIPISINNEYDLTKNLLPHIKNLDAVLMTRDGAVVQLVRSLSKMCDAYDVILCSSDEGSVRLGADVGFGPVDYMIGQEAAQKALEIFLDGASPAAVPVTIFNQNLECFIHPATFTRKKRGMLALEQVFRVERPIIVHPYIALC